MEHPDRSNTAPTLPAPSRGLRWTIWSRWILLGCYLVLSVAWYYVFLSVSDPLGLSNQPSQLLVPFVVGTLVLFGVQFLFLLGAPQLHWPRPRRRRSIFVSLAAGSAIAVLLSLGIVCAGLSLYKLIDDPDSFRVHWVVTSANVTTAPSTAPANAPAVPATPAPGTLSPPEWGAYFPWTFVGILLAGWAFWFLVFALVGGGQWTQRFRRMYQMLIAGTVLELLITIPIDAQVRRRTNCYCGEGTFYALAIGLTAILWTFGPGVAILFLVRRQHRLADSGRCLQCGYDLRGLDSARCPECGLPFRRALDAKAIG